MGLYVRRSVQAVAVLLTATTTIVVVGELGSRRLFLFLLGYSLLASAVGVWLELMRQDRGIIAATRLVLAAMKEPKMERSDFHHDETKATYPPAHVDA